MAAAPVRQGAAGGDGGQRHADHREGEVVTGTELR
jgi:hypothetical protein